MAENKKETKNEVKDINESMEADKNVVSKEDYDNLVQAYVKLSTRYNNLLDLFNIIHN